MSDFSLTLVLRLTTSKIINDVSKVQIKSEEITPFGGIFHVRELFFTEDELICSLSFSFPFSFTDKWCRRY